MKIKQISITMLIKNHEIKLQKNDILRENLCNEYVTKISEKIDKSEQNGWEVFKMCNNAAD